MWKSLVVTAFLLIAGCFPASAAVTIDGTCDFSGYGTTPKAYSGHTVGAGLTGGVLVVAILVSSNNTITLTSVNWDNSGTPQAMSLLESVTTGSEQVYIYGLRNPTAGALVFNTSWTGGGNVGYRVCSFQGADVTSDATAFPVGSRISAVNLAPISVSVPSATGNIAFAGFSSTANFSSTTGVNDFFDNTGSFFAVAGDYWNTGSSNTIVSASPGDASASVVAAVEIAQTGVAATASPGLLLMGSGP